MSGTAASLANLRPWTDEDRAKRWTVDVAQKNAVQRRTSLARYIREHTQDGKELTDFMLRVLRGEKIDKGKPTKMRDRLYAADWLANRAFGLPKETIELTNDAQRQERLTLIATMSAEDRAALKEIFHRALETRTQTLDVDATIVPTS